MKKESKKSQMVGNRYGRLFVTGLADDAMKLKCKCDCGNEAEIYYVNVMIGKTKSCGCLRSETMKNKKYNTNLGVILKTDTYKCNKTGHTGVWYDERKDKYQAYISFHGKKHHLGTFVNYGEAVAARLEAEEEFFEPIKIMEAEGTNAALNV